MTIRTLVGYQSPRHAEETWTLDFPTQRGCNAQNSQAICEGSLQIQAHFTCCCMLTGIKHHFLSIKLIIDMNLLAYGHLRKYSACLVTYCIPFDGYLISSFDWLLIP